MARLFSCFFRSWWAADPNNAFIFFGKTHQAKKTATFQHQVWSSPQYGWHLMELFSSSFLKIFIHGLHWWDFLHEKTHPLGIFTLFLQSMNISIEFCLSTNISRQIIKELQILGAIQNSSLKENYIAAIITPKKINCTSLFWRGINRFNQTHFQLGLFVFVWWNSIGLKSQLHRVPQKLRPKQKIPRDHCRLW